MRYQSETSKLILEYFYNNYWISEKELVGLEGKFLYYPVADLARLIFEWNNLKVPDCNDKELIKKALYEIRVSNPPKRPNTLSIPRVQNNKSHTEYEVRVARKRLETFVLQSGKTPEKHLKALISQISEITGKEIKYRKNEYENLKLGLLAITPGHQESPPVVKVRKRDRPITRFKPAAKKVVVPFESLAKNKPRLRKET